MEKKSVIVPWISICCLLLGMYTGFATEFGYTELDWPFLTGWTAVLSAVAVLLVLQWRPLISGLLTIPALILAGCCGYSQLEKLSEAVDVVQLYLGRQMEKYNGSAVVINEASDTAASDIPRTWAAFGKSLQDRQMEILFLLCGFFIAVYICVVTMRLSFRIYGLLLPYTVMLVGLSVGASPGIRSVFLLFTGTALALYWVERSEADSLRRESEGKGLRLKIPWALTVLCLCLILCTAVSFFLNKGTQKGILSHAAATLSWQHQKERQLKEFGDKLIKRMKVRFGVDNDGKLDNDTPEYDEKDVLRFTIDSKPTDDIYLKGFVGNNYSDGSWTSPDDTTELADEINKIIIGAGWRRLLRNSPMTDGIRYRLEQVEEQKLYLMELDALGLMRTSAQGDDGLSEGSHQIMGLSEGTVNLYANYPEVNWKIEYVGAGTGSDYYYHPYFDCMEDTVREDKLRSGDMRSVLLFEEDGILGWQIDRTIKKFANTVGGKFYYMGIQQAQDRADILGGWSEEEDWFALSLRDIQLRDDVLKAYLTYARKKYTKVPEYLRGFTEFADNQGFYGETAVDIAIQIRASLWRQATYSTKLKKVPHNQDYVEYFLLKQKKGFCEHFATAGTLLFRHYGIPAKFVSGYRIPVEAFVDNGDGTYTANVQDSYAHAWSEVLIGGFGWYPMEMTPGAAGIVRGQHDEEGTKSTKQPEPVSSKEALETATPEPTSAVESPQAARNSASASRKGTGRGNMTPELWWAIAVVVFLLLCISVWIWCRYSRSRYSRSLKKLKGQNGRTIRIMTEGLMCFLEDCGLRDCRQMTEKEWIEQAFHMAEDGDMAAGNETDMDMLQHIIEKAFFANEAVDSQEYQEFLRSCNILTEKVLGRMKGWYKFTILLYGWRKQFAEWKKLCYDRTE